MKIGNRWIALWLAAFLALGGAGCGARPRLEEPETEQLREVYDGEVAAEYPFAGEYPALEDMALPGTPVVESMSTVRQDTAKSAEEIRAVWISYLEMETLLLKKSELEFTANIGKAFDNIKAYGLNTVIVQVRPFGDALYKSDYFPWSYTITGTEGVDPGYDPLQVMVTQAAARGLRIEAWVNPYRIRAAGNKNALSSGNKAKGWLENGNRAVISYNDTITYNPASETARQLIVDGIVEIVRNYKVDGVHIDDYFYPTNDAAYDQAFYAAYQKKGGALTRADWRRANVETLVKQIYDSVKAANPDVLFGISPQSSVQNNYEQQYLDVEKIAGTNGYCDYICPQIYFGYDNDVQPYQETLNQWSKIVKGTDVRLYVGLAAYKIGATDSWAGDGKNEWVQNTDLMKKMVMDARDANNYTGFVLYRYDFLFKPSAATKAAVQAENKNLKAIL